MPKHNFTPAQKWSVFTMHGGKCWQCKRVIDLKTMQVDHVIPENHGLSPTEFAAVIVDFKLPSNFDLNSYENWLPSCGPCNSSKGAMIFDASPMIQRYLQKARTKAGEARALESEVISERRVANALNIVEQSVEGKDFDFELIKPLVQKYIEHNPASALALISRHRPPGVTDFIESHRSVFPDPATVRLTPYYSVIYVNGDIEIVRTPRGTGFRSALANPHSSFFCGHCGSDGPWNGAICLSCGRMDDGD